MLIFFSATVFPVILVILIILICTLVIFCVMHKKSRRRDDWEIDYNELELQDHLGTGVYGEVHKALWKGTEVAVKMVSSHKVAKEMQKNFREEVLSPIPSFLTLKG